MLATNSDLCTDKFVTEARSYILLRSEVKNEPKAQCMSPMYG